MHTLQQLSLGYDDSVEALKYHTENKRMPSILQNNMIELASSYQAGTITLAFSLLDDVLKTPL